MKYIQAGARMTLTPTSTATVLSTRSKPKYCCDSATSTVSRLAEGR